MQYTTPDWQSVLDTAERVGVGRGKVEQWLRDGQLVGRREGGSAQVPAQFVSDTGPVKGLPGVIRLLRDARFSDAEIVDWLFRSDSSLPGTPIEALATNRGTEVKRRAQVAGY